MEPVQVHAMPALPQASSIPDSTQPARSYQPHTVSDTHFALPPDLTHSFPDHIRSPKQPALHIQQPASPPTALTSWHTPQEPQPSSPAPASRELTPHASLPHASANGHAEEEVGVAAGGRRHPGVKAKSWAGSVVWAKLAQYPWWPAQVLADKDPYIPPGADPPRRGAVPVRFFGTYEFSYIQSQRALAAFDDPLDHRRAKCDDVEFKLGVREADEFMADGTLPDGFFQQHEPTPPPPPKARRISKGKSKKVQRSESAAQAKAKERDELAPPPTAHRKERMLRMLALKPPSGSPYAHTMCLAGIEGLLAQQNSRQSHAQTASEAAPAPTSHLPSHPPPQLAAPQAIPGAAASMLMNHVSHGQQGGSMPISIPQQHSVPGQGGLGPAGQSSVPGVGHMLQIPNMSLHGPHVNLLPNQPNGRLQFGALSTH